MTPDDRRRAIVAAALEVAAGKGLGATTVRDVAARMGTSSGLIHHYFDSMDEVLAAAFEQAAGADLAEARAAVEAASDPLGALAAFLDTYSPAQNDSTMQLWLDAWSEAARRPALQAVSRRLNLAWLELLRGVIDAGRRQGLFDCPDPEASAWRILSVLDGLALQVVAHGQVVGRAQAVTWAASTAESELGLPPATLVRDIPTLGSGRGPGPP